MTRADGAAPALPAGTLEARDVYRSFGGVTALAGCSLRVEPGTITGLIGPNGSGKTTLFNCITGFYQVDQGQVTFGGVPIQGRRPNEIVHMGVVRTFQVTRIFRGMSVLENMIVPLRQQTLKTLFRPAIGGHEQERAEHLLEFFGIVQLRTHLAGSLSFGQQKLLELASALMVGPKLVMLDEPAGGLNPIMIERMAGYIHELNQQGTTFCIVEHNMDLVMQFCDPVFVLHRGQTIASGPPSIIREDPLVLDAYLGD
ncbi:MAG: ABC transporter ATP-binding protein [Chloroflexi bacterium]|nr:ABC transporter ATP-binding protein [Chloroflexota bacterium]